MESGSIYNKSFNLFNSQDHRQYNPNLNRQNSLTNSIPTIPPELPPVPEAYRSAKKDEKKMKLIYTKSGFYSKETNIHGFFTILSKSIVKLINYTNAEKLTSISIGEYQCLYSMDT